MDSTGVKQKDIYICRKISIQFPLALFCQTITCSIYVHGPNGVTFYDIDILMLINLSIMLSKLHIMLRYSYRKYSNNKKSVTKKDKKNIEYITDRRKDIHEIY